MKLSVNEVSSQDISNLTDKKLVELLKRLLDFEAHKFGISSSATAVQLDITIADGGEDGRAVWESGPAKTDWLPGRRNLFQVKATAIGPQGCYDEMLEGTLDREDKDAGKETRALKRRLKENWVGNGHYILFCNKDDLNEKQRESRKEKIVEAIIKSGNTHITAPGIEIYDASRIAQWVNCYPQLVNWTLAALYGFTKKTFLIFDDWSYRMSRDPLLEYIGNKKLEEYLSRIDNILKLPQKSLRITGLSGLGKTRLVHQYFHSDKNLQKYLLYVDCNEFSTPLGVLEHLADLLVRDAKSIVILDNCEYDIHERAVQSIQGKDSNIISLSNETKLGYSEDDRIELEPEDFIDVIPKLLDATFPELGNQDKEKIAQFAQGFPLVAVLLAKDKIGGKAELGRLNDDKLMTKLLGIKPEEKEIRNTLRACSIFTQFGYDQDLAANRISISQFKKISRLERSAEGCSSFFYETCQHFIRRGILEKKGRYVFVKPKPLALRLAQEWWENCPPEDIDDVLTKVSEFGLSASLCDQISKLDFVPEAKQLVKNLCGELGPFGKAEVLNTVEC
jgi:hypothetical protein